MKKYLFFIFLFVVLLFYGFLVLAKEEILFSVERGQNVFQIGRNLEKDGLIKNRFFFDFYVLITGNARKLRAGDYFLNPSMSTREIAKKIIAGDTATITLIIPEGWTLRQIEERLGFKLPGENLEGFLFPDTYRFPVKVSGEEVVKAMRENFDKKLTQELQEEVERQGKTIFEIVTMASLLEKEVKTKEDKELVSGILWKRLENGIPLQVDATITYITGKNTTKISVEDTQIDSPYNTYKYAGLPSGPIANPGLESIQASVYPESSEYWYYLSTPDGETIFSKNLQEHNLAKNRYLK